MCSKKKKKKSAKLNNERQSGRSEVFAVIIVLFVFSQDCCSLSALECFRANLNVQFNATKEIQKLHRSLGYFTVSSWVGAGIII